MMILQNFNLKQSLKNDPLISDWEMLNTYQQKLFNDELMKELDIGHKLYGVDLMAIMKNGDDVVYRFIHDKKVTSVHLTFCRHKDTPPFPLCGIYHDMDDWYQKEYFPSLQYPLNKPEILSCFEQIVMGYVLDHIPDDVFKNYIYHLDNDNLPFDDMDYLDLISLEFDNKQSVVLFLNTWYNKKFIKADSYDAQNDLMDLYRLKHQSSLF